MSPQHAMAPTNLEKRLERFFSRRRSPRLASDLPPSPTESIPEEPLFPSPSFIRPKTSRMMARDEVSVPGTPDRRTRSVPDTPFYPAHTCHGHSKTSSTSTTGTAASSIASAQSCPQPPTRSSSLCRRQDTTLATLPERRFQPFPSAFFDHRRTPSSPSSPPTSPQRAFRQSLVGAISSTINNALQRLDTPPSSDGEDDVRGARRKKQGKAVLGSPVSQSTPEPSPEPSLPLVDNTLGGVNPTQFLEAHNHTKFIVPVATEEKKCPKIPLRKALSTSSLTLARRARLSDILDEPTFGDFMALSDDDIAESRPDSPLLPEAGTDTSSRSSSDCSSWSPSSCIDTGSDAGKSGADVREVEQRRSAHGSPLLAAPPVSRRATTTSPRKGQLASKTPPAHQRPAAAAAFEAARIASRYGFDLVYVVSLWPKDKDCSASSPPSSPSSSRHSSCDNNTIGNSDAIISQSSGMSGRLMAAYGLGLIKSPFKISTAVHQKILHNEGWIEYRNSDASADEFARGYACSLYTTPGNSLQRDSESSALVGEEIPNNSGIVFAAYKKPGGTNTGCESEELGSLHLDAKNLVDMLVAAQSPAPVPKMKTYSPFPPADRISRMPTKKRPSTAKAWSPVCHTLLPPTLEASA